MITLDIQAISKKLGMNIELVKELIKKFAEYSPLYLNPLKEYVKIKDYDGIASKAYEIKSASALMGIFDLSELADNIFLKAKLHYDIDYLNLIDEIEKAFLFLATI